MTIQIIKRNSVYMLVNWLKQKTKIDPFLVLQQVLEEVTRCLNLEKLLPCYHHTVTISCLKAIRRLQKNGHLPSDPTLFQTYAQYGHFMEIRLAALEALVDYVKGERFTREIYGVKGQICRIWRSEVSQSAVKGLHHSSRRSQAVPLVPLHNTIIEAPPIYTSDQISIPHYTKVVEFVNRDCLSYLHAWETRFHGEIFAWKLKITEWIYLFIVWMPTIQKFKSSWHCQWKLCDTSQIGLQISASADKT